MCARFSLTATPDAVRSLFRYDDLPNFPPRYNIAPTQPIAIVAIVEGRRRFVLVRWGLIPAWAKNPAELPLMINARAETVADKPAFRGAFRHRRMLVPATGFYEWRRQGKIKHPFHIRLVGEPTAEHLFAFAGIWETYLAADGSEIDTAAILTLPSTEPVASIHDRMPAVVKPADFDRWLDCRGTTPEEALRLILPGATFELTPVSMRVNSVGPDDEGLIVPLTEPVVADLPTGPRTSPADAEDRDLFGEPIARPTTDARRGRANKG